MRHRQQLQAFLLSPLSRPAAASVSSATAFANPVSAPRQFSFGLGHHRRHIATRRISRSAIMASAASSEGGGGATNNRSILVDPFCFRQFAEQATSKGYAGTVFNISIAKFEEIVNSRYDPSQLQEGYAPFCKHLFLANDFTDARVNVLPITKENEHCLRTAYEARNEKELPVLTRHFDRALLLEGKEEGDVFPVSKYLDLILYSREQINKENAAMGKGKKEETAPYGIVSIKAQDVDHELPMTPITAMRNALGKEQGGSGVELVREEYMKAVDYWKDHANVL